MGQKSYIEPTTNEVDYQCDNVMQSFSAPGTSENSADPKIEPLTRPRRGEWGDLWKL